MGLLVHLWVQLRAMLTSCLSAPRTRFDLGLQLDSAEVRGVLMTEDGIECGAATFEFLGT